MWSVKFSFDGSNMLFGKLSKKFNVVLSGYPISFVEKEGRLFVTFVGNFENDLLEKVVEFLNNDELVVNLEVNNNFLMIQVEEDLKYKEFYSSSFVYVSPVVIKNGVYYYHLSSWNREDLNGLISYVKLNFEIDFESLINEKIDNISLMNVGPNLTDKQKKAYNLAVDNGYYEYPKEIELKELARIMNISYSTYQQHLKYAEKKFAEYYRKSM